MANETQTDLFGFKGWKTYGNKKTNTYEEFKDKFKPKLTTDDCYTPQAVMDVVNDFVRNDLGAGDFVIKKNECSYTSELDCGHRLFGGGFYISRDAVARKAQAIRNAEKAQAIRNAEKARAIRNETTVYPLSERERALVNSFSAKS